MGPLVRILLGITFAIVCSVGCFLDRSGIVDPYRWSVEPTLFCPGDPVTVSWDLSAMRRSPENCRPRNNGYDSLIRCASNRDCPDDGVCYDGYCCQRAVYEDNRLMCDAGTGGCYPGFDVTITANGDPLDPPVESESRIVRGTRTDTPAETTTYTISGGISSPALFFEESKVATRVTSMPETNHELTFLFRCDGTSPGWSYVDLDSPRLATANVRIVGIRNSSGHVIQLTGGDPATGPVRIARGEVSTAFNGPVGGRWTAVLDATDPARLTVPRCGATNITDPWPNLQVEMIFGCAVEP